MNPPHGIQYLLLANKNFTPRCKAGSCSEQPKTRNIGNGRFRCPWCGHLTNYPAAFVEQYLKQHEEARC